MDDQQGPVAPASPGVGYRAGLEAGELRFQRCGGCGGAVFYPRVACPGCGGAELAWERSAGLGTVYSTTALAVREGEPRNVVLVDLDEGFRMMSRVDGVAAHEVAIGMRVRLDVVTGEDDEPIAIFRPLEGGS